MYGTTECSPVVSQVRLDDSFADKTETLGRPVPGTEVKISDLVTGEVVPCGTVGELCVRGYCVMTGYFEMPEQTAAAIDTESWYHTGDLASMDERGYLRIEGRLKEMIIRGGENIYPREIEDLLFEHPKVAEVAVIGVPDARWGEEVAAFVRSAPGESPTADELFSYCREHARGLQDPMPLGVHRDLSADRVRQGSEVRPARAIRRTAPRPITNGSRPGISTLTCPISPGLERTDCRSYGAGSVVPTSSATSPKYAPSELPASPASRSCRSAPSHDGVSSLAGVRSAARAPS